MNNRKRSAISLFPKYLKYPGLFGKRSLGADSPAVNPNRTGAARLPKRALLILVLVAFVTLLVLGHRPLLRALGTYLVVEDSLEPAAAIVVTGGHTPFRAMEAANLYHQRWAPRVVLIRSYMWPEDRALQMLGIFVPQEWQINREVLIKLKVPTSAIVVLDERPRNSDEEIQTILRAFQGESLPVIVITSKYHTRRLRLLWRKLASDSSPRLIVRASRDDPFDSSAWWTDRRFVLTVVREYLGLFHTWIGLPVGYQVE